MINCLEISHNQEFLYSGDSFGIVKSWEIAKGLQFSQSKRCHQSFIYLNGMVASKRGELITTSRSDEIRVWTSGLDFIESYPFPADCLKLVNEQMKLVAGRENVVKVYSLLTKQEIAEHVFPTTCIFPFLLLSSFSCLLHPCLLLLVSFFLVVFRHFPFPGR